jgi:hypothetical protein
MYSQAKPLSLVRDGEGFAMAMSPVEGIYVTVGAGAQRHGGGGSFGNGSDLPLHHALACTSGRIRPIKSIDVVYKQPAAQNLLFIDNKFNDRAIYADQSVYRARGPAFDRQIDAVWPRSEMQHHERYTRLTPVRCLITPTARHRLSVGMRTRV